MRLVPTRHVNPTCVEITLSMHSTLHDCASLQSHPSIAKGQQTSSHTAHGTQLILILQEGTWQGIQADKGILQEVQSRTSNSDDSMEASYSLPDEANTDSNTQGLMHSCSNGIHSRCCCNGHTSLNPARQFDAPMCKRRAAFAKLSNTGVAIRCQPSRS